MACDRLSSSAESGGEQRRDDEPDRRRELEAGICAEQHVRRRERVQREKAEARHERERDEKQPRVAASPGGRADGVAEPERDERSGEHEPEVGNVALPAVVDVRDEEEEREQHQRRERQHDAEPDQHRPLTRRCGPLRQSGHTGVVTAIMPDIEPKPAGSSSTTTTATSVRGCCRSSCAGTAQASSHAVALQRTEADHLLQTSRPPCGRHRGT